MISKKTMQVVWEFVQEHGEEAASEHFDISIKSVKRYIQLYLQHILPEETETVTTQEDKIIVTGKNITNELEAREFAGVSKTEYDTHRIDMNFRPDGSSQYKISFVPKKNNTSLSVEEYANAFSEMVKNYKTPVFPMYQVGDSKTLITVSLCDWHHGKQVWGDEISGGGENWDIHESRDEMARYIGYVKHVLKNEKIDTILLEAHGDVLNVDNAQNTTVSGTPQSEDSRFIKTQWYMENMLVDAVSSLREIANNVVILIVPGNHDATRILMLGRYVQAFFRNDSEVTVMCDASPRKAFEWGRTLLAYAHEMKGNVIENMYGLWPEACSRCKDLIMNTGHLHTRKDMQTLLEYMGKVKVVQHPAMVPNDAWADGQGYNHVREGLIRVFDWDIGQTAEYMYRPYFTR